MPRATNRVPANSANVVDKLDGLCARIDSLLESHDKKGHVNVTHTQAGMGAWGGAAIAACFFSTLMVVALAIVVIPELHDDRAWLDQYRQQIAKMQAQIQNIQQQQEKH